MTEFLCLGGPLHGQELEVPEPQNGIRITPSDREQLLRPPDAPPLMPIMYVLRGLAAETEDGKKYVRPVMALEQIPPQQLMMALASVLVANWVREGEEIVQDTSGADPESGLRGTDGPGGDSGTGTGLIAP